MVPLFITPNYDEGTVASSISLFSAPNYGNRQWRRASLLVYNAEHGKHFWRNSLLTGFSPGENLADKFTVLLTND
jgi:hypothetical protein